jgi:bifunctional UDP-N-acetylglucosamine pyrophosphorylase/glucosamine-1-phosphate N-acetyltransferase
VTNALKNSGNGVIILAAGIGKRMKSALPKVLHEIGGQPLIFHIIQSVKEAKPDASIAIVVGHEKEKVQAAIESRFSDITFITQPHAGGTGHAAQCAMNSPWGESLVKNKGRILVLPGDTPLLSASLVAQMLEPLRGTEVMRLLTTEIGDPTGYGRVVRRGKSGPVLRITEEKDANLREKQIREIAVSIYLFQASFLKYALAKISNKNAQNEYYLTDTIAQAVRSKKKVDVLPWRDSDELRGINDLWELAIARKLLNERCIRAWALKGVRFVNPWSTWVDVSVELSEDVMVGTGVILLGHTKVARGVELGPRVVLKNVEVGEGAVIKTGTVAEESKIGKQATLGPYAHLRPESVVGAHAKIGNFVELKKAKIGEDTSVAHLSYLGDAEVGKGVNIGCGFVTCNFDGRVIEGQRKHRTWIGDGVFVGSDCQVVAPIKIGNGAYIASGSTITEDVEADAMAIARSRQTNKPGYAKKLKK